MYRDHGEYRAPEGSEACLESVAFHDWPVPAEGTARDITADNDGEVRQSAPQPNHVIY
jgi:hypothetical protein